MLGFINMPAGGELLIIGLVALIALGPEQLPAVMRKLGALSSQMRTLSTNLKQEFLDGLEQSAAQQARKDGPPPPSAFGDRPFDPTEPVVPRGFAQKMAAEGGLGDRLPDEVVDGGTDEPAGPDPAP